MLVTLDEFLFRMTDAQLHPRLFIPAGLLALQEMAEEALLQPDAIIGIELQPVGRRHREGGRVRPAMKSRRFFSNCSGVRVSGPATGSPVTRLRGPRSPTPCCTGRIARGYQLEMNSE